MIEAFPLSYGDGVMDYLGLTADQLRQSFIESSYSENVYNSIIGEYVLDQDAADLAFETYYAGVENGLANYKFSYILTDTREEMDAALAEYAEGAEFMNLVEKYSTDYIPPEPAPDATPEGDGDSTDSTEEEPPVDEDLTESEPPADGEPAEDDPAVPADGEAVTADGEEADGEDGTGVTYDGEEVPAEAFIESDLGLALDMSYLPIDQNVVTVLGSDLPSHVTGPLYALEPGGVSEVIELLNDEDAATVDKYLVINLVEIYPPDRELEKTTYTEGTFIPQAQNSHYDQTIQGWIDEFDYEINEKALRAVSMYSN
jgi:hypothetical protein